MKIVSVESNKQINEVAKLADIIWHDHFPPIIGIKQTDYMIGEFQSVEAINRQIDNQGYSYYLLEADGQYIGYTGICPNGNKLFLSKIYILKKHRGKGYAGKVFDYLTSLCTQNGWDTIWLTVNRFNENTIRIYEKKGFKAVRTQKKDIGGGFVMDDYIMEKEVS